MPAHAGTITMCTWSNWTTVVWSEPRFRKANPNYRLDKPLVYVGITGTDPDLRFDTQQLSPARHRPVERVQADKADHA